MKKSPGKLIYHVFNSAFKKTERDTEKKEQQKNNAD